MKFTNFSKIFLSTFCEIYKCSRYRSDVQINTKLFAHKSGLLKCKNSVTADVFLTKKSFKMKKRYKKQIEKRSFGDWTKQHCIKMIL